MQKFLADNVPQYGEYKITVNDEQLFRPYKDGLTITSKQGNDQLESVELFSLMSGDTALAYGWYGNRRDLLGSIRKGAAVSGLRVKVGNIQVGDHHLLDRCFRENRFNSYSVGEIHVCNQSLLPNSRRDDFVDNKEKTLLYNLIERDIGLPLSKEIRRRSRVQTKTSASKVQVSPSITVDNTMSSVQENHIETMEDTQIPSEEVSPALLEKLLSKCGDCRTLQQLLRENLN